MKKIITTVALGAVFALGLTGCGSNNNNGEKTDGNAKNAQVSIGMLTDTGGINDKSFNQGTWEGIQRYQNEHGTITSNHASPSTMALSDLVTTGESLITAGHELIIMSGYAFEEAVAILQDDYSNTKFIILDGEPMVVGEDGELVSHIEDNTLAISFAEEQSGFMAGIAAALETETGKVGFIGGSEIPPVQRFGWGFLAGVAYANENFGLDVKVVDYIFQGTFSDVQAGSALAGGMYDKGIDIIFSAAGAVGTGVIGEATTRTEAGERVFVIGVDSDQYEAGMMANGESVILTSAVKRVDNVAYEYIEKFLNGEFPGGQALVKDATTDGVGLPDENPNLSDDTQEKADDVFGRIKSGEVVVPKTAEDLTIYLNDVGYDASGIKF